jgi:hypothetical protein
MEEIRMAHNKDMNVVGAEVVNSAFVFTFAKLQIKPLATINTFQNITSLKI